MDLNKPVTFEILVDDQGQEYYSVDNARIIWTNFAGVEKDFNHSGKRNFVWAIPDVLNFRDGQISGLELAQRLAGEGYNIKHRSSRDGLDGEEFDHVRIDISYETAKGQPIEEINPDWYPRIYLLDDNNCALEITRDGIGMLDGKRILYAYFEFRPCPWNFNNKTGTAAKLKRIFLNVRKDPLADRFRIIDSQAAAIRKNEEMQQARNLKKMMDGANPRIERNQVPTDPEDLPFEI